GPSVAGRDDHIGGLDHRGHRGSLGEAELVDGLDGDRCDQPLTVDVHRDIGDRLALGDAGDGPDELVPSAELHVALLWWQFDLDPTLLCALASCWRTAPCARPRGPARRAPRRPSIPGTARARPRRPRRTALRPAPPGPRTAPGSPRSRLDPGSAAPLG